MPWLETSPVEQRERFIRDHRLGLYTMTELCARYGISRKTGYKWLARFDAGRPAGAAAIGAGRRTSARTGSRDDVAQLICAARRQHPSWGPEKLLHWLRPRHPDVELARHQHRRRSPGPPRAGEEAPAAPPLPASRRRARRSPRSPTTSGPPTSKGHFRTARWHLLLSADDRRPAHPLPAGVPRPALDEGPRACGRSSTGCFASTACPARFAPTTACRSPRPGIHGLSQLNVWWLRLGIQHQRILPGPAPAERRARTDAQDPEGRGDSAARGPRSPPSNAPSIAFRRVYNDERPHQFLRRPARPASLYRPSRRAYTGALPPIEYPGHFIVKRVTNAGTIRFKKRLLFIANALKQHPHRPRGGRRRRSGRSTSATCCLGRIDERDYIIRA